MGETAHTVYGPNETYSIVTVLGQFYTDSSLHMYVHIS